MDGDFSARQEERERRDARAVASITKSNDRRDIACDLLIVSGGDAPATALLTHAGATTVYDDATGQFRLGELPPGVWACGQVAGQGQWGIAAESGERVGLEVARTLGLGENGSSTRLKELRDRLGTAARIPTRCRPRPR